MEHNHDHHGGHHVMETSTVISNMNPNTGHDMHHMDENTMTHGQMEDGSAGMHEGHMMMPMYFHFGLGDTVLFQFWKVNDYGGLLSSMLGIFIAAMLYEGLKYFREYLYWKNYNMLQYQNVNKPTNQETERVINNLVNDVIHRQPPSLLTVHHIIQTLLHIIQIFVSYLLMLIFMTYNVWLCLAVVLGSATGYFLFGWRKSLFVDVTEHCH
ncbi:high affinity copper uptake protein 1 isoform X4 [Halyomorpha halys]|nr:high affinity copper uptake protein 1 isoform X4 [Halyomorpha halys]XP_014272655.1 high affinity copper uptake protein 1 isoform X4 [Halyomorpha halys]XP_014272656.1 high affinity copper uptake protein 1 isoform X4 [Halyomorpha halys]